MDTMAKWGLAAALVAVAAGVWVMSGGANTDQPAVEARQSSRDAASKRTSRDRAAAKAQAPTRAEAGTLEMVRGDKQAARREAMNDVAELRREMHTDSFCTEHGLDEATCAKLTSMTRAYFEGLSDAPPPRAQLDQANERRQAGLEGFKASLREVLGQDLLEAYLVVLQQGDRRE